MSPINLNYLTLVTALANFILGYIVLRSDRTRLLNKYFFIFTTLISAWAFAVFYFQQFSQTLFALQTQYVMGGLVLVFAFPWVLLLTDKKIRTTYFYLIVLLSFVMVVVPLFHGYLISSIEPLRGGGFNFTQGPLFNLFSALLAILIAALILKLAISRKNAREEERSQLGFVLLGISIFALVSLTVNILLPSFNINPVVAFDVQSSLIWVAITAYAITKRGLFDIKVIATESFVVLLLSLILGRVVTSSTKADVLFESAVLALTAFVGYFLIKSVRSEVSRREEIEKLAKERTEALHEVEQRNKNLATLQKISQLVLNEIDMKKMAQTILDTIPDSLDNCIGSLLSLQREGHLVAYTFSQNEFSKKIYQLVGSDLEKYDYPLKRGFNLMHNALLDRKAVESNNLSDFICPPISKTVSFTIQKLLGMKYMVAFPLTAGEELLGVMLFTYRVSRAELTDRDFEIARTVADEMSLAIQRALAFQKLKDANAYLAQLDKMKDEFISMASHELNTPLAAIEGYLSMVLEENMGKVDSRAKTYLGRAYDSSKRLAELILDLLNVSRIEQGRLKMKFSKSNMVELANSVIHELQVRSDAKKLYLKVESEEPVVETWCDPDRIREVYVNLINNSIKFTEKGGVTVRISKKGNTILSAITDTGRGIAKAEQTKLFQKFSQIKRDVDQQQGTGLGLYISKNFVELHKGRIWVESEEGKGATFYFELPIMTEPPRELAGAQLLPSVSSAQIELGNKKVPTIVAESSKTKV